MYTYKPKARMIMLALVAALLVTMMVPVASYASAKGHQNTAAGLAGLAAFLMIRGDTVPGIAAAIGAGYAYNQYAQERNDNRYWNNRNQYQYHGNDRYYHNDNNYGRYNNRDQGRYQNTGRNYRGSSNWGGNHYRR